MSLVRKCGRLGNNIIRNLSVSLIAEKHNLHAMYYNKELTEYLGINLFCGKCIYNTEVKLNDDNYFAIYYYQKFEHNLDPGGSFFQTKQITNLLYNYLHSDKIKQNIIEKNNFKNRYNANNDLYIHIRLTDVAHFNPGINYYINAIKNINYDKLYISTDDDKHDIIKQIIEQYPDTNIIQADEITTIQFASTSKNIILSHGSFSAIIGYLAFFSNVHYPEYESDKIWYGDMFSIDGWNKLSVK